MQRWLKRASFTSLTVGAYLIAVVSGCNLSDSSDEPRDRWEINGPNVAPDMRATPAEDMRRGARLDMRAPQPDPKDMRARPPAEQDMRSPPITEFDMRAAPKPDMRMMQAPQDMRPEEPLDMRMPIDLAPPVDMSSPVDTEGGGLECTGASQNQQGCTGVVLASGSMMNSDSAADARAACEAAGDPSGSCCSFHIFGAGEWFLTDGTPQNAAGVIPDQTSWGRGGWACEAAPPEPGCAFDPVYCEDAKQYAPEPGYVHVGVWDSGSCAGNDADTCASLGLGSTTFTGCEPGEAYRCERVAVDDACVLEYHYHYCD